MAWTTTVAAPSAAMIRLRATKHQRCACAPGGSSEITAPRAATAACSRQPRAGYGTCALAGEHADRPPGRLERAGVRRRVDPEREAGDDRHARRGQPAPERARDLEPVRRRPPRADDRDAVLVAAAPPGRRARAAPPAGRRGRAAAPGTRRGSGTPSRARPPPPAPAPPARRSPRSGARPRAARRARAAPRRAARARAPGARPLLELDLEPPGDRRDQVGPPQAVVARGHAASASVWASRRGAGWRRR